MQKLTQCMTAVGLVASLGLAVPSTLGGSASADVNNSRGHNPNLSEPYTWHCDLDGNGDYETEYLLSSTSNSEARAVQGSNLVLMRRLWVDVIDSYYTVIDDPTGTAEPVHDPDVYWFDGPHTYPQGGGKPKGWQTVRCISVTEDEYTATADDAALGLGFVEGVTYLETDTKLWDATMSQVGKGKARSARYGGKHHHHRHHRH